MKRAFRVATIIVSAIAVVVLLLILFSELRINSVSKNYLYDDVEQLPDSQVVLVLGTSKYMRKGSLNPFYTYRMDAAKELYDAGKVRVFVLSGDNRQENYNEPKSMQQSLIALGIPDSIIYLDYAGLRTLDSVIRMNKVFGQNNFIVVSQKFHNQRAIYIARTSGLEAYAYNAQGVPARNAYKTFFRERLARVKVFIDKLTHKKPRFLGEPIEIS
ncbi:YdcF family protein [Paludibacteraceae bacterium OttesenSCG-928-F17]|nr:YdcF family protein [Paludibacteraceae bacterium OttesenSCG-928-F17]